MIQIATTLSSTTPIELGQRAQQHPMAATRLQLGQPWPGSQALQARQGRVLSTDTQNFREKLGLHTLAGPAAKQPSRPVMARFCLLNLTLYFHGPYGLYSFYSSQNLFATSESKHGPSFDYT